MDAQAIVARLKADPDLEIGQLTAAEIHALKDVPFVTAVMFRRDEKGRKVYADLEDVSEERLRRKIGRLAQTGWMVDRGQ